MDEIRNFLQEKSIPTYTHHGISTVYIHDADEGVMLAVELLSSIVTSQTLLLLSGGRTPKDLYQILAQKESIVPSAVGMIDERFGKKFHEKSNETMLKESGLLRYFEMRGIPFYPILSTEFTRQETADAYDKKIRELLVHGTKSIGILGIGLDGHTAGLPALSAHVNIDTTQLYEDKNTFVTDYLDTVGMYGERITMTFLALSQLDTNIVLVFGSDKRAALDKVFSEGSESAIPGRFFKRPDIAKKTLFITDQKV